MPLLDRLASTIARTYAPEPLTLFAAGLRVERKAAPYPGNGGGGWIGWDSSPTVVTLADVHAQFSSVVMGCVASITQAFPEAPVRVLRSSAGVAREAPDHPLTALVNRPNPEFSAFEQWASMLVDYAIDGNAYYYKARNRMGLPVELWPLPVESVEAHWPRDGSEFLTHYIYRAGPKRIRLEREDVIHFRNARKGLDWRAGREGRYGRSPLADVAPDIAIDQNAATAARVILKKGHPGVMLVPKEPVELDDLTREAFYADYRRRYTGEGLGDPMLLKVPVDVKKLTFGMDDLALKEVRRIAEERVSSALNVPPIVAGLGVGFDHATYSNYEEAVRQFWRGCLIPMQREIAAKLTSDLLPELGRPGEFVEFDTTKIQALREDEKELHERERANLAAGGITLNEYRARIGREPLGDEGEVFYLPSTVQVVRASELAEPVPAPAPLRLVEGRGVKQASLASAVEDAAARGFLERVAVARYRQILDAEAVEPEEAAG